MTKDVTHLITRTAITPAFSLHYTLDYFVPLADMVVEIGGEEYALQKGKVYLFNSETGEVTEE